MKTAVGLIPFAGIAFLWFIGVIRTRLGEREDKLFATVFLGSGLLFVALLFLAGALLATVLTLFERGIPVGADSMLLLVVFTKSLMGMFGARMAAVFTISVSSVGMRTQILPRWLVVIGYLTGRDPAAVTAAVELDPAAVPDLGAVVQRVHPGRLAPSGRRGLTYAVLLRRAGRRSTSRTSTRARSHMTCSTRSRTSIDPSSSSPSTASRRA